MLWWSRTIKLFLLLLYYHDFAAVMNSNVNIWYAEYLICNPCERVIWHPPSPKGSRPAGCWLRTTWSRKLMYSLLKAQQYLPNQRRPETHGRNYINHEVKTRHSPDHSFFTDRSPQVSHFRLRKWGALRVCQALKHMMIIITDDNNRNNNRKADVKPGTSMSILGQKTCGTTA